MIDQALSFLKDKLNVRLQERSDLPADSADRERDAVVFIDGDGPEPISFSSGSVTALLVNIEQERLLRAAEPYRRRLPDGTPQQIRPELRLDLSVLFVARYKEYAQSLRVLSEVIHFFQEHQVFLRGDHPELPSTIEKLILEPITLPFGAQNEVWTALRTAYQPSVLYRVRTLVFEDPEPTAAPVIDETGLTIVRKLGH